MHFIKKKTALNAGLTGLVVSSQLISLPAAALAAENKEQKESETIVASVEAKNSSIEDGFVISLKASKDSKKKKESEETSNEELKEEEKESSSEAESKETKEETPEESKETESSSEESSEETKESESEETQTETEAQSETETQETSETQETEETQETSETEETQTEEETAETAETEETTLDETEEAPAEDETKESETPSDEAMQESKDNQTDEENKAQQEDIEEKEKPKKEEEKDENPIITSSLFEFSDDYISPVYVEDFRFWTVSRVPAYAKDDLFVYGDKDEKSTEVGVMDKGNVCYILENEEDSDWLYVESGKVRGFVLREQLMSEEEAEEYEHEIEAQFLAGESAVKSTEELYGLADTLVDPLENPAFTYLRATVNQTIIEKDYALVTASQLNIREGKGTDHRVVGTLNKDDLVYVIADADDKWIYVESGDVRGFVNKNFLNMEAEAYVEEKGEGSFSFAEKLVEPADNKALYYTMTSIKGGVPTGEVRASLLEFAAQFVGNPYVWGGTSLTHGCDCSGFAQQVMKQYGVDLPRTSREQARVGQRIKIEDALPGDLIFYDKGKGVYHVAIYAGDGKTIEAKSRKAGIVHGTVGKHAVYATRVLKDAPIAVSNDISVVNATEDMYGDSLGQFKLTFYCSCAICNGKWAGENTPTASGAKLTEGTTIAVDPDVIPYGTKVIINGHVFEAQDCGGAIQGNRIDIYVNNHQRCNDLGVKYANVYLVK